MYRLAKFGLLLVAALVLVGTGCSRKTESPVNPASVLHRGLGGEPGSLDPAHAGDTFSLELLDDLYEGLTSVGPDGRIVPGVAQSWTVSEDGLTYSFKFRDAHWSNGQPVTARQFIGAWQRVLDPKSAAPGADNLRIIAGARDIMAGRATPASLEVSSPRDDELIVKLEAPAVYFPELLTHAAAFPIYSDEAATTHTPDHWVSNGPFTLSAWRPGSAIEIKRNSRYWDVAHVALEAVEFIPAPDEGTELQRYRAGELDVTASIPPSALTLVQTQIPQEVTLSPFLATAYYAFNLKRGPFKDNRELRQAVSMAIDRNVILKTILPFGQRPAYGFVAEGVVDYTPQSWDWKGLPDAQRIEKAKALYAKAGYSAGKPLHLTLLFNSNPTIKQLAIAIADMWRQTLGIETTLEEEEYRVFLGTRKDPMRFDLVRLGWTADYNDAGNFLETLRSDSANNDAGYRDSKYDTLIAAAGQTPVRSERRARLEEAERLMLGEYPILPIYFYTSKRLVKPYVNGVTVDALNRSLSRYISLAAH